MNISKSAASRILSMSAGHTQIVQRNIENLHAHLQQQLAEVEKTKTLLGALNDEMEDIQELCGMAHDVLNQEDDE